MKRADAIWLVVLILLIAALFGAQGYMSARASMKKEAIQRGFAEYNSTNGVWQWKEMK